jgi:hypothetical protein
MKNLILDVAMSPLFVVDTAQLSYTYYISWTKLHLLRFSELLHGVAIFINLTIDDKRH